MTRYLSIHRFHGCVQSIFHLRRQTFLLRSQRKEALLPRRVRVASGSVHRSGNRWTIIFSSLFHIFQIIKKKHLKLSQKEYWKNNRSCCSGFIHNASNYECPYLITGGWQYVNSGYWYNDNTLVVRCIAWTQLKPSVTWIPWTKNRK